MSTFLFDNYVFGPVKSRRLGNSLGINLLPIQSKTCNFNCVYCECGLTLDNTGKLPSAGEIEKLLRNRLEKALSNNEKIDSITYAGNGEPTMHPEFERIIDLSINLRNELYPKAIISVLSNAMLIRKSKVKDALDKVDRNILKIDSVFPETINLINCPIEDYNLNTVIQEMKGFKKKPWIQTLFLKGTVNGISFDNSSDKEVNAWLNVIQKIQPEAVMIYSLARNTPYESLKSIGKKRLLEISELLKKLSISTIVST